MTQSVQTRRQAILSKEQSDVLSDPPRGFSDLPINVQGALAFAVDQASTGDRSLPPWWAFAGTSLLHVDSFDPKALLGAPTGFNPASPQWRSIQVAVAYAYKQCEQIPPPWTNVLG